MRRLVALALPLAAACSTSKVVVNGAEFASHAAIDFENVRFRRPSTPLYDAEAPKAAAKKDLGSLDCERSEDFFSPLDFAAIRGCLARLETPELEWNMRKGSQPALELRDPEDAPECFRATLGRIPFPRELVYVVAGDHSDRGECYTSRLALEGGGILGWELPRAKIRLRVGFPLGEIPKTDREVERMLRAWILSVYRGGSREGGSFHGRFLPEKYCQRCFAASVPAPTALWPSRRGAEPVRSGFDPNL